MQSNEVCCQHNAAVHADDCRISVCLVELSKRCMYSTEEVILCICGLHVEEGLMVQCGGARCGVWQHARCMRVADTRAPHHCHNCRREQVTAAPAPAPAPSGLHS